MEESPFYFVLLSECGPYSAVTYDSLARRVGLESQEKVYTDAALSELHTLREKQVREEITKRLRGVCSNFPQEDFDRLVKKMAERQLRDERRLIW
jgi:hypothetical protein